MNKTIDQSNHTPRATSYVPVIGLEVHVELKTESKMFCSCSASYFGKEPNTHTCPVCLGLPGALPVPNKTAIEWCLMIGMALNCRIPLVSKFDRKNYFYPDLAKGYQISQYDEPFCLGGFIELSTGKKIGVTRVHMEEDTAKLTHQGNASLIDFNRSGVPLVEIVTEPDFENASEVVEYLKKLQQIVRYLDVSNANMEKGDMRLEPNISLRPAGQKELPKYKVEVKNINSFRFVEKAINFEVERQAKILDEGKIPAQETRGWDEKKNGTVSQRLKEEANDYRYFPEPDIPPIHWKESQIEELRKAVEAKETYSPEKKIPQYIDLGMSAGSAATIAYSQHKDSIFGTAIQFGTVSNDQLGNFGNYLANIPLKPGEEDLSLFTKRISFDFKQATQTVAVDDIELENVIKIVLEENPKAVTDYKSGKETVIMFLLGQVMRKIGKKIDAQMVKEKIIATIK